MTWVHLSQIPEQVRAHLEQANASLADEDARLEQATLQAMREARLRARVHSLCSSIHQQVPTLSIRKVFLAVSLLTGLSYGHVRRLYYRGIK